MWYSSLVTSVVTESRESRTQIIKIHEQRILRFTNFDYLLFVTGDVTNVLMHSLRVDVVHMCTHVPSECVAVHICIYGRIYHTLMCCSTLQCVVVNICACIASECVVVYICIYGRIYDALTCCGMLQCVSVNICTYIATECVAVYICIYSRIHHALTCCGVLQCVAVYL